MDNHASSSRSRPKTPGNTTSIGKKPLFASAEQTLNAWVESNAKDLLEAIAKWTRAEPDIRLRPKTVPFYKANERSDKNLRYALVSVAILRVEGTALSFFQGPGLQDLRLIGLAL